MTGRTLEFVSSREDAGPARPDRDVVILDMAWTPRPGERDDIRPLRPVVSRVLERVDVVDGSLALLDRWAESAGAAEAFIVDEVTWWFHVRMIIRWDVQELLIWRLVLGELAPAGRYGRIVVPSNRPQLAAVAQALESESAILDSDGSTDVRRFWLALRRVLRRAIRAARRAVAALPWPDGASRDRRRREAILRDRIAALAGTPGGVLAVASAGFFQVIELNGRRQVADPYLALVLDRLAGDGAPVATVALALDHSLASGWTALVANERLLPNSIIGTTYASVPDLGLGGGSVEDRLPVPSPTIDVDGVNLGPAIEALVRGQARGWLEGQRRGTRSAEGLLRDLRPSVLFVDHESVRTQWLAAARRLGIPIVAVQHGVIFENNPEYCRPPHPADPRPDVTCVFGPAEREILMRRGGYLPGQVVVTGSSRSDPDLGEQSDAPDERAAVRRELGVADGDRLLVISAGHNPVMGDLHGLSMLARVLGGPLPGVHVVIKLHPQDRAEPGHAALVEGLAAVGGYEAPRITVVREVDLYRLLRAADAHLGQYSTVLTDAVVTGTPNMIVVGQAFADIAGYVAAKVATPVRTVDDVRAFMAAPRPPPAEDRKRFLDRHFKGGDATGRIASVIRQHMATTAPGP